MGHIYPCAIQYILCCSFAWYIIFCIFNHTIFLAIFTSFPFKALVCSLCLICSCFDTYIFIFVFMCQVITDYLFFCLIISIHNTHYAYRFIYAVASGRISFFLGQIVVYVCVYVFTSFLSLHLLMKASKVASVSWLLVIQVYKYWGVCNFFQKVFLFSQIHAQINNIRTSSILQYILQYFVQQASSLNLHVQLSSALGQVFSCIPPDCYLYTFGWQALLNSCEVISHCSLICASLMNQ